MIDSKLPLFVGLSANNVQVIVYAVIVIRVLLMLHVLLLLTVHFTLYYTSGCSVSHFSCCHVPQLIHLLG